MKPSIQQRLKSIALALITLTATVFAQAETKLYYIHNDHLGTPVAMTDENQVVVWQAKRKPFGETTETTNTVDQQARFPGQYQDEETGLSNNYHRDYDPSIGRYLQSDPIGLRGGLNTYGYVGGNPISYIDPDGLQIVVPFPGIVPRPVPLPMSPVDPLVSPTVPDALFPNPNSPNDPNSSECRALLKKMNNIRKDIAKREGELASNPLNLPERIGPGERLRDTVRGHRKIIRQLESQSRKLEKKYSEKCSPLC